METFLTDLAEQRDALCIIQDIHIGKHEGVSPVFTLRPAETPPLYLFCRNSLPSEDVKMAKKNRKIPGSWIWSNYEIYFHTSIFKSN